MKVRLLRIVAVLLMIGFVAVPSITIEETEDPIVQRTIEVEKVNNINSIEVSEMTWTTKDVELFNDCVDGMISIKYLVKDTPVERIRIYDNGISTIIYDGDEYSIGSNCLTTEEPSMANYNRWEIELTESEIDMLADIMFLEAHTESDESMIASIEVVFNRITHDKFPNTLEEVLSQSNQFVTWKHRHLAEPTEKEYELIYAALYGETDVLSEDYVFFGRGKYNNNDPVLIDNHWFCKG